MRVRQRKKWDLKAVKLLGAMCWAIQVESSPETFCLFLCLPVSQSPGLEWLNGFTGCLAAPSLSPHMADISTHQIKTEQDPPWAKMGGWMEGWTDERRWEKWVEKWSERDWKVLANKAQEEKARSERQVKVRQNGNLVERQTDSCSKHTFLISVYTLIGLVSIFILIIYSKFLLSVLWCLFVLLL